MNDTKLVIDKSMAYGILGLTAFAFGFMGFVLGLVYTVANATCG